ncbi:MAG: FCD domain-containing protein [Egibacteraceae bacterium]
MRIGLELQALRRVTEHDGSYDRPALETLRADRLGYHRDEREPDPAFALVDEDFHVRLAAVGNGALAELLAMVNARIRVVRMHDFLTAERVRHTIGQHLGIVTAVLDGDLDAAEGAPARAHRRVHGGSRGACRYGAGPHGPRDAPVSAGQ